MKRFKYLTKIYYNDSLPDNRDLNYLGSDGWELIETVKGINKIMYIFKKEYEA